MLNSSLVRRIEAFTRYVSPVRFQDPKLSSGNAPDFPRRVGKGEVDIA